MPKIEFKGCDSPTITISPDVLEVQQAEIERLTAENERLRAAITEIAAYDGYELTDYHAEQMVETALEAMRLNQQSEPQR